MVRPLDLLPGPVLHQQVHEDLAVPPGEALDQQHRAAARRSADPPPAPAQGALRRAERAEAAAAERERQLADQRALIDELRRERDAAARGEREARRELALAAGSSAGPSQAEVVSLKSLVEAKQAEVVRLQEEMEGLALSHESRMIELQESCQTKVRELRRVHEKQLLAVGATGEDADKVIHGLRADLERARRQARLAEEGQGQLQAQYRQELQDLVEEGAAQRQRVEDLEGHLRRNVQHLDEQRAAWDAEREALEARARELQAREREAAAAAASAAAAPGPAPAPAVPAAVLDAMEGQLVNLSKVIRGKELELAQLRETTQAACLERGKLRLEAEGLRAQLEAALAASPPAKPSPKGPTKGGNENRRPGPAVRRAGPRR